MARRIKKVTVYKQDYLGQKTSKPGAFEPKVLAEFKSVKMAQEALREFGEFTHKCHQIYIEAMGIDDLRTGTPTLIRRRFSDYANGLEGYEFEMYEKGIFFSKPEDIYPSFRMYYSVEYYD